MNILPWFLSILLGGASIFLFIKGQDKDLQLATLRAQVENLQAGHEQLESQVSQNDPNEMERLRKETDEVYKLRSEVTRLQKQNREINEEVLLLRANAQTQNHYVEQADQVDPTLQAVSNVPEDPAAKLARENAAKCMNNMSAVEEAKTMWAVANNKQAGEAVTLQDITTALPNSTMPLCPNGGTYNLEQVGVPVSCSVAGHSLLP